MSRPFPDTFDDRSPQTPLSGGPPGNISYQANVNRQKTKKWVEAKPVSYGGDDWGDEYEDEYSAAPPPPPMPKATGFRQPGQGASGFKPPGPGMPSFAEKKKSYGDLPRIPNEGAERSATNPQMFRKNSFQTDDERRTFSSGPSQIAQAQGISLPPLHTATPPGVTGLRKPSPVPAAQSPTIEAPGTFPDSRGPIPFAEQQQPQYYHNEQHQPRALSPQVGAPYGRNESPVSPLAHSTPSISAPRKSSLSQGSDTSSSAYQRPSEAYHDSNTKPWPGPPAPSQLSLTAQNTAPTPAPAPAPVAKSLPFIRPADIYKKHQEELARARQSQETERPNVTEIMQNAPPEGVPVTQPPAHAPAPYAEEQDDRSMQPTGNTYGWQPPTTLEPVPERGSEYSIHDMAAKSPVAAYRLQQEVQRPENPPKQYQAYSPIKDTHVAPSALVDFDQPQAPPMTQNAQAPAIEESRRFSVSPKLPDFNRLSGFGFDMWSKPDELETAAPAPVSQPRANTEPVKPLQREPSLGFTSVVHQAFDRNDSFSEAESRSGDIRRTDSASTGTEGISPIIGRGHGGSIGDRLMAERVISTPAIAEEVEPQLKRPATPNNQVPFHLGHRRDISLPSGDNSPARTPIVANTARSHPQTEAQIAQETDSSPEADVKANTMQAGNDERPRLPIPGGWQSYATTATAASAPGTQTSEAEQKLKLVAEDAQPETERTLFSPPVSAAAAPPAVEDAGQNLPTPDPALAPIVNPYAAVPLDSRLDDSQYRGITPPPASKSQETITSLQPPPVINEPGVSPGASVGPTPPAKDTPKIGSTEDEDYFPPPVPLKVRSGGESAADERLQPPSRPEMLPTLSTNTSPFDDENDRLRKEIVKSLSPRQSLSGQGELPSVPNDNLLSAGTSNAPRDSMYLPSEYDNYWAATEEIDDTKPGDKKNEQSAATPLPLSVPAQSEEQSAKTPPIPAFSPKRASVRKASINSIPAQLEQRYSWEMGNEQQLTKDAKPTESEPGKLPVGSPHRSDSASPAPLSIRSAKQTSEKPQEDSNKGFMGEAAAAGAAVMAAVAATAADVLPLKSSNSESQDENKKSIPTLDGVVVDDDSRINEKSLSAEISRISAGNNSTQQIPAVMNAVPPPIPLAKDTTSPYVVSPLNSRPPSHVSAQPSNQSYAARTADHPKPRQFREIMNMPTPEMRIQAYEEERRKIASRDSGLINWLTAMKSQELDLPPLPPPRVGQFGGHQGSHSRTDSFASGQPAQQHQYTPSASSPFGNHQSRPSGGPGLMSFGAPGSKTQQATQQAKEKSKELLHTAGIFGGKASKAGKGLLAKGKSRWLSSHGDKESSSEDVSRSQDPPSNNDTPIATPQPTPAKRHASWLPHLHSHSSSGRSVSMTVASTSRLPQNSNANTIPHPYTSRASISDDEQQHKFLPTQGQGNEEFFQQRQRADSLSLKSLNYIAPEVTVTTREVPSVSESSVTAASSPARPAPPQLELNLPASSLRDETWSDPSPVVPPKDDGELSSKNSLAAERAEEADQVKGLDENDLRPPKPIGKYQPSWDPFNATPIAEEEFGWDKNSPPADRALLAPASVHQPGPPPPTESPHAQGRGSATVQEPSRRESDEWVLISPASSHFPPSDHPPKIAHPPFTPLFQPTSPCPDTAITERGHSRGVSEVSALTVGSGEIIEASEIRISKPPVQARISYDHERTGSGNVSGNGKDREVEVDEDETPRPTPFDLPGAFVVTPATVREEFIAAPSVSAKAEELNAPPAVGDVSDDEAERSKKTFKKRSVESKEDFDHEKREPSLLEPDLVLLGNRAQPDAPPAPVGLAAVAASSEHGGTKPGDQVQQPTEEPKRKKFLRRQIAPSREDFVYEKREPAVSPEPVMVPVMTDGVAAPSREMFHHDPRDPPRSAEDIDESFRRVDQRIQELQPAEKAKDEQEPSEPQTSFDPLTRPQGWAGYSREFFEHDKREPDIGPEVDKMIRKLVKGVAPLSNLVRKDLKTPGLHEQLISYQGRSADSGPAESSAKPGHDELESDVEAVAGASAVSREVPAHDKRGDSSTNLYMGAPVPPTEVPMTAEEEEEMRKLESELLAKLEMQKKRDLEDAEENKYIAPSREAFNHEKREPIITAVSGKSSVVSREQFEHEKRDIRAGLQRDPRGYELGLSTSREGFEHEKRESSARYPKPSASSIRSPPSPLQRQKASITHERSDSIESASAAAGFSLPPIRRTSTFGIGIVPKAKPPKERFAIDDEDTDNEREGGPQPGQSDSQVVSPLSDDSRNFDNQAGNTSADLEGKGREERRYSYQEDQPLSVTRDSFSRPPIMQQGSSEHGSLKTVDATPTPMGMYPPRSEYVMETPPAVPCIDTSGRPYVDNHQSQQPQGQQPSSQASSIRRRSEVRQPSAQHQQRMSVDSQRRGAPFTAPVMQQDRRASQPVGPHSATASFPQRPSFDAQRSRQSMESQRRVLSPTIAQPPKIAPQYAESRPVSIQRVVSGGVPPSSAERYPGLFQSSQPPDDEHKESEVPEYPVVASGHLPRQQATEYQIPGVGPPEDDPRNNSRNGKRDSRRNSGFFKDIGGRLSRASSRERRSSMASPLDDNAYETGERDIVSRDTMSAESDDASVVSGDKPTKKEKRQSLLGILSSRATTSHEDTPSQTPPVSRGESMVTHRPNSRTDLLAMRTPKSPVDPEAPKQPPQKEKKRGFFGKREDSGNSETGSLARLSRQSTGDRLSMLQSKPAQPEASKKKGRFSLPAVSKIFGKKEDDKNVQWLPLAYTGVRIKVKNEQERQDFANLGLLRMDVALGTTPQQQQPRPQPVPQPQIPAGSQQQPQTQPAGQPFPHFFESALSGVWLRANSQLEKDFFIREDLLKKEVPRGDWSNLSGQAQAKPTNTSNDPGVTLGIARSRDGPPQPIAALAPAPKKLNVEDLYPEKEDIQTPEVPARAPERHSKAYLSEKLEEAYDLDLLGSQQSLLRSATFDTTSSKQSKEVDSNSLHQGAPPVQQVVPVTTSGPYMDAIAPSREAEVGRLPFPLGGGLFAKPMLQPPDSSALYGQAAPSRDVPDPFAVARADPTPQVSQRSAVTVPTGLVQGAAAQSAAAKLAKAREDETNDERSSRPMSAPTAEPQSKLKQQDVGQDSKPAVPGAARASPPALPTTSDPRHQHRDPVTGLPLPIDRERTMRMGAAESREPDQRQREQHDSPPPGQRQMFIPANAHIPGSRLIQPSPVGNASEESREPESRQRMQQDRLIGEREVYIPTGSLATQVTPMHLLRQQNSQSPPGPAADPTPPGGGRIQIRSPAFDIPQQRAQTSSPRSPLGAPPIMQGMPPPVYQQPPSIQGQHQQYAARLAQTPPQLQKRPSSGADRHVLQKRPSSAAREEKANQPAPAEPKKRGLFSSLLGGKRSSALGGKKGEKAPAAQQQQQQQPPQQFGQHAFNQQPTVPLFAQQQQGQPMFQNRGMPGQPLQQFASQPIPGQYYAQQGGDYPPPRQNLGGMGQPQHQSMPAFRSQQEYDDYIRHQQAMQMQMQRQSFGQPLQGFPQPQQIPSPIPVWKRALRDTPNPTSPVNQGLPPPAPGTFANLPQQSSSPHFGGTPIDDPRLHLELRPDSRRSRALSTEDLVARSPAKQQFGQQAPYQLSLPGGDDDDEYDSPHAHRMPKTNPLRKDTVHHPTSSQGSGSGSPYRQPMQQQRQPGEVPLPDTLFSPINEAARDMPPPPPPKSVSQIASSSMPYQQNRMLTPPQASKGLDRSNTVMSDVSSITIPSMHRESLSVPSASPPINNASPVNPSAGESEVSSASTPQMPMQAQLIRPAVNAASIGRSEPVLQRVPIPSDIRSPAPAPIIPLAMPEPRVSPPPARAAVQAPPIPGPSELQARNGNGVVSPDHEGLIYDNSREEKIVVEDATVRRVNNGGRGAEEEAPVMSATSFPGDMWTPGGWEEWRD